MKKLPLKIEDIKVGDILWDDFVFSTGYLDNRLGNYYIVTGVKHGIFHENDSEYIQFIRYSEDLVKRGYQQFSLDMFEMKHEGRIYNVKFDSPAEEARFRLMI